MALAADSERRVVVVGGGNAAFCAAHAARAEGAEVVVLEKAPREQGGGNSFFTAGAFRIAYGGMDGIRRLIPDLTDPEAATIDLPRYDARDFRADLDRLTGGRCEPELAIALVGDSFEVALWLRDLGIPWELMYARQSFRSGDRVQFFGGLAAGITGGGRGLMAGHLAAAARAGIEVRYGSAVTGLTRDGGQVGGVVVERAGEREEIRGACVVLASGGFEANPELRRKHLGPGWEHARVRGTAMNTGEGIRLALEAGAQPFGQWDGCHAVFWDAGAPPTGDWELTNQLSRLGYPLGIIVNREGRRFVDEGADFRNFTYARYGAEVLRQPGAVAHQLFDQQTLPLLRQDEYGEPSATRIEAGSLGQLARLLEIDEDAFVATVRDFNSAVQPGVFNPSVLDGKGTRGIDPPKSNWALPLERPPFVAFPVTTGITFTFGGLRIDVDGRVLNRPGEPLPGLYAAGELVGGLFYGNYPGGSGLTAGAVFGRRAGRAAAMAALGAQHRADRRGRPGR